MTDSCVPDDRSLLSRRLNGATNAIGLAPGFAGGAGDGRRRLRGRLDVLPDYPLPRRPTGRPPRNTSHPTAAGDGSDSRAGGGPDHRRGNGYGRLPGGLWIVSLQGTVERLMGRGAYPVAVAGPRRVAVIRSPGRAPGGGNGFGP